MENVEFFGIRHLSPAGAFELRRKLDKLKPDLILVEGPSDLNDLQKWVYDKDTKFPIAFLAYTKKPPVQSILYPFAVYSPEVQAILWAKENNVECRFMDLPSSTFLSFQEAEAKKILETPIQFFSNEEENSDSESRTTESVYRKLEIKTGEEHDSFWERNFEQLAGTDEYQETVNVFGRELRSLSVDDEKETAETLVREAFMRRQISDSLKNGKKKILCVCGAFHVSALNDFDENNNIKNPMTDKEIKKLPKSDSSAVLMPYSYFRLSKMSGYGAGNKAPSYYGLLWNAFKNHRLSEFAENYLVSVAREHREAGNIVSSAEVIEAVRLSKTLAILRGSQFPTLDDLHDAAVTAMGHGNFSELVNAFAKIELKSEIGKLPKGVARTSIQDDFYREIEILGLSKYKKETAELLELDLRENLRSKSKESAFKDLYRSYFFNRLSVLKVHFASEQNSNQQYGNWKEIWSLQWTPDTEIEIVESSLSGETVIGAASFEIKRMTKEAQTIDEVATIFEKSIHCGLSECAVYVLKVLENLSVEEAVVYSIAKTCEKLSNIIRFGDLRQFDSKLAIPLLERFFLRFCLILEQSCVCDGDAVEKIIESIDLMSRIQLNHDFLSSKNQELENRFVKLLEKISNRDDLNPKCSGFAMSVLLERGIADENLLLQELSRRLSSGIPADLGAAWFEGLSAKNHNSLIARLSLWRNLSDYIKNLSEEEFKRAVVFLRRAFADFSTHEKVLISENLAEIWGYNEDSTSGLLTSELTKDEKAQVKEIDTSALDDFDFDDI